MNRFLEFICLATSTFSFSSTNSSRFPNRFIVGLFSVTEMQCPNCTVTVEILVIFSLHLGVRLLFTKNLGLTLEKINYFLIDYAIFPWDSLKDGKWSNVVEMTREEALAELQRILQRHKLGSMVGPFLPRIQMLTRVCIANFRTLRVLKHTNTTYDLCLSSKELNCVLIIEGFFSLGL